MIREGEYRQFHDSRYLIRIISVDTKKHTVDFTYLSGPAAGCDFLEMPIKDLESVTEETRCLR